MTWDDRRGLARLAGAGVSAAAIASAGCLPAGAASARHAASPSPASVEPARQDLAAESSRARPANAVAIAEVSPASRDSGAEERRRTIVIAGLTTTAVTAAAGVSFAILSRVNSLDADDLSEDLWTAGGPSACAGGQRARDCAELHRLRNDAATFLTLTVWTLLGASVIELATGVYGAAATRSKSGGSPRGSPRVSPALDPTGAALTVTGAF
jgi:hypothetical protein